MADDSQSYTPEELAALESVADMLSPAECRRLIHQLHQQTARAEHAEGLGRQQAINNQTLDAERDEWKARAECADRHEADYLRVVAAALDADPIPACQRDDDQLEPPWEVLTRLKAERQEARAQAWRNAECASAHTTEAHTLSCALASYARERDTWKARAEAAEANVKQLLADILHEAHGRDAARTALATECAALRVAETRGAEWERALAAAAVERARLVAALERMQGELAHLRCRTWDKDNAGEIVDIEIGLNKVLAASPHADLAAVRAAVTALQSYADGHVDCTSCARQALAALPSWCREQP